MTNIQDKESGHAAILFVLMFSTLFSLFILGSDGARALQDKARLEEASEVAALTVAAENSDTETVREATAKKIIQAYFPSTSISDIDVTKLSCDENSACDQTDSTQQRFFEYGVSVTVSQDSWFYSENSTVSNMGETYSVAGSSIARKYQSEAVDVVLVADFSGSMASSWSGGTKKADDLKSIIVEIATELEKFNGINGNEDDNKLAIVGFNLYTSKIDSDGDQLISSHLTCDGGCSITTPGKETGHGNNKTGGVDSDSTVSNVFTGDDEWESIKNASNSNKPKFSEIQLTLPSSDYFSLSYLDDNFNPQGSTASYTGLIRGAQVAALGANTRRIIIILSDGEDTPYKTITRSLEESHLCTTIIDHLNSLKVGDDEVEAKLAIVGFDYDVSDNAMSDCVANTGGEVYEAKNTEAIKNKILELISEEIGHSAL